MFIPILSQTLYHTFSFFPIYNLNKVPHCQNKINIVVIQYFVKYISSRKKDCPSQSFFHHPCLQTSHGNSSIFSKATCSSGIFPLTASNFTERLPVSLPDPFPVPVSLFRDVFSGKVRRKGHSLILGIENFSEMLPTLSLIADWRG